MPKRQPETALAAVAHQTATPEAVTILPSQTDGPLPLALGARTLARPQAHADALTQASGGQLTRAGVALRQLQQGYGNRYVQQVVNHTQPTAKAAHVPIIQTKLMLGPVDDPYEREAERMAQRVAGAGAIQASSEPSRLSQVQPTGGAVVDSGVEAALQRARGGGSPLDVRTRTRMEQSFGADFGGVRLHKDAQADQLNRQLQARAFTNQADIFFRRGEYNQPTLAHELAHVVQQQGRKASSRQTSEANLENAPLPLNNQSIQPTESNHSRIIRRLSYAALPLLVSVGGKKFEYDENGIYWLAGVARGYDNGNHFTLMPVYGETVTNIHFSVNFPSRTKSGKLLQSHVYFWYYVNGDAPNIRLTGRKGEELSPELQEYLTSVKEISKLPHTWGDFQAIRIGDLPIDEHIIAFIEGLNKAKPRELPPPRIVGKSEAPIGSALVKKKKKKKKTPLKDT